VNPRERTGASRARSQHELSGPATAAALDEESRAWVSDLQPDVPRRNATVNRLHDLLLRVARSEASRRRGRLPDAVLNELDDLCVQAASDAVVAILRKLDDYRGAARFTTWASKFVILEFSSRLRRRSWHRRELKADPASWERFADKAPTAQQTVEYRQVLDVLDRAVAEDLSERQRMVFSAAVLEDVPIDVLAERLGSTRGAVYKIVYDARSKLRGALARAGHGEALA
jgi:RNA polymerase sigma-70 factor (ECF subfamily)